MQRDILRSTEEATPHFEKPGMLGCSAQLTLRNKGVTGPDAGVLAADEPHSCPEIALN